MVESVLWQWARNFFKARSIPIMQKGECGHIFVSWSLFNVTYEKIMQKLKDIMQNLALCKWDELKGL